MDCCPSVQTAALRPASFFRFCPITAAFRPPALCRRRPLAVTAGPSHCEPSSLNTPLVPRSPVGRHLSRVFQNQRPLFQVAVSEELKNLADDRDSAIARMLCSDGSDEACLHRRIAELKERECTNIIEDVMYILILSKFSDINVLLVPKLSKGICNGRLEIGPRKDWELESIYSDDVLDMIKEHVCDVTGLRRDSSIRDHWATTQISLWHLSRIYVTSALRGYFLKSATTRHRLEQMLSLSDNDKGSPRNSLHHYRTGSYGLRNLVLGNRGSDTETTTLNQKSPTLSCYMKGFNCDSLDICSKVRSTAANELLLKHTIALFEDGRSMVLMGKEKNDRMIQTSFSSLKRLVLEAVAFGSFLWDIEEHVDSVYSIRNR